MSSLLNCLYVVDTVELPTPGTHFYTTNKFASGFAYHGFEIRIVTDLKDLKNGSFVLISNHGMNQNREKAWQGIEYLAQKCPDCVYIGWFFHESYSILPFKRFILTGEHFHFVPELTLHKRFWDLQQTIDNYVPWTFASPMLPEQVGSHSRTETLNGCFIGTRYKDHWVSGLPNTVYLSGMNHGKAVSEEERIQYFLSSKIAFGFHHDDNVRNNVVVERVFEGMAFGCVVISDSPAAGKITEGIVQVAHNQDEFLSIYHRLLNDDKERKSLQTKGYEWIKQHGLYVHTAKRFIDKANELCS